MENTQYNKKKSSFQKRFENHRRTYSDKDLLMEQLYNSRLSRETSLKTAKNSSIIIKLLIIGLMLFIVKIILLISGIIPS